jgi:hypothetical protein
MGWEYRITPGNRQRGNNMAKQPYIDYRSANLLTRMYDFINRANQMRRDVHTELDYMSRSLEIMQNKIREMKEAFTPLEDPNKHVTLLEHDIGALRAAAWEAGLTKTLFEKLKDRVFRNRFTGCLGKGNPVPKEEIEDHYDDEESA